MTSPLKLILCVAFSLQDRTVDGVELEIVLWTSEVEQTESIDMSLVLGWKGYLGVSYDLIGTIVNVLGVPST